MKCFVEQWTVSLGMKNQATNLHNQHYWNWGNRQHSAVHPALEWTRSPFRNVSSLLFSKQDSRGKERKGDEEISWTVFPDFEVSPSPQYLCGNRILTKGSRRDLAYWVIILGVQN